MVSRRKSSVTESVLLLASEDVLDAESGKQNFSKITERDPLLQLNESRQTSSVVEHIVLEQQGSEELEDSILKVHNLFQIEASLLSNVLLAAFDSTITASTYTIIGSEFNAVQLGSWITTAYLITSTAFQPLYGSFSDVLGRRACYFFSTTVFAIGCITCSLSPNIYVLFFARALTGIGGGGLITLATVINSDIIPPSKRGLFQGFQNILIGVGSILGASLGGFVSEKVGWRFCFLLQVPISIVGLAFGVFYIKNQDTFESSKGFRDIDLQGSLLLVSGLTLQLLALNAVSILAYSLSAISILILLVFIKVEISTSRTPIIPFSKIHGASSYLYLFISTLTGFSNFAYIFILPLLFQIVLGDTPSRAGLRLAIPSLFTSLGALATAYFMNRDTTNLIYLVHGGVFLLGFGNFLSLFISPNVKFLNVLLTPATIGLGMSNPALLFSFIFQFPKSLQASSTSTLYLFRSIGNVWGVALSSSVIQRFLKVKLEQSFKHQHDLDLDERDIDRIIRRVTRSLSYIKELPDSIQLIVESSYEYSIRNAQKLSILVCVLCFLLCLLRDYVARKHK